MLKADIANHGIGKCLVIWYSVLELELWYSFLNFVHTKHGKTPKVIYYFATWI